MCHLQVRRQIQIEDNRKSEFVRLPDELGRRMVGSDHRDGLGARGHDLVQAVLNLQGAAVVRASGDRRQIESPQGQLRAGQAVKPIGVLLIEDGNLAQPQNIDQVPDRCDLTTIYEALMLKAKILSEVG